MKNTTALLFSAVLLGGCAGSASHKVVAAHQARDVNMSCTQLEAEIIQTQIIIDDVNRDKEDVSGADVMDGILWFPFNLIAKSENYQNALEAANSRIANLESVRKDKNCQIADAEQSEKKAGKLTTQLRELSELYKSGALTEAEYKLAKSKVLNEFGQ